MSYIGNQVTSVPHIVDIFSGDNSTTIFGPMVRAPAGTAAIAVFISGSYKTPGVDYSLDGNYIIFNVAPASGTSNIVIHHLGNGTTTQVPSDGSVTTSKLAGAIIRGNNIVAGQITGNLIAANSISGNQITTGAISGNLIATNAISGNQIGLNAVSANNIVNGQIGAEKLTSNLSLSVSRISEVININTAVIGSNSAIGANVNLDILNTTVYYFSSNTSGNVSFNLRGNNTTYFNDAVQVGNTISVVVTLRHNTAAHRSGVNVMIDGGYIATTRSNPDLSTGNLIFYSANNSALNSPILQLESNVIAFTVIKKGDNSYLVYMSNTIFGLT